jgi:hypothetical protein
VFLQLWDVFAGVLMHSVCCPSVVLHAADGIFKVSGIVW